MGDTSNRQSAPEGVSHARLESESDSAHTAVDHRRWPQSDGFVRRMLPTIGDRGRTKETGQGETRSATLRNTTIQNMSVRTHLSLLLPSFRFDSDVCFVCLFVLVHPGPGFVDSPDSMFLSKLFLRKWLEKASREIAYHKFTQTDDNIDINTTLKCKHKLLSIEEKDRYAVTQVRQHNACTRTRTCTCAPSNWLVSSASLSRLCCAVSLFLSSRSGVI